MTIIYLYAILIKVEITLTYIKVILWMPTMHLSPKERQNILDQKQETMRALHTSQEAMREGMRENTEQGKPNGWPLPKIQADVQWIIHKHSFQSVSWMKGKQEEIESEMREAFKIL